MPSCSRRTTRSTSTAVLPVPAPAETNTRPRRSIASAGPRSTSRSDHRATRQMPPAWRRHHSGQLPAIGSCRTVARPDPGHDLVGVADRAVDLRPELARAASGRWRITPSHLALDRHPAHLALAAQRAVQAGHRLDPQQVARRPGCTAAAAACARSRSAWRRVGALAGLVVPDRAPRRHAGVAVDPVDGAGHGEAVQPQALLQVRRRRLGAEPHLVVARHQRRVERCLAGQEALQVALQPADLSPAGHARRDADAGQRVLQAAAHQLPGGGQLPLGQALDAQLAGHALVELVQRGVRDRAASPWARTGSRSRPAAGTARRTRPTSTRRTSRARSPRTAPARPGPPAPPRFAAAGAADRRGELAPACASSPDGSATAAAQSGRVRSSRASARWRSRSLGACSSG